MTDKKIKQQILTVVGIALCVILIPMLIINCTLLIKGWTNNNKVPSVFGYSPMIVLTDSMAGSNNDSFNGGDLIFIKTVEAEEVKKGDVISFFDPTGNGSTITSHRVVDVINENGKISFKTKGDNNNTEDKLPVPSENLVGAYTGFRIAGAGNIAMFMQTPWGLIICVIVPIILLIAWDAVRRARYNKKRQEGEAALLAELEELRAEKANKENFESKYNNETTK
ncbi:MAG: signal peptidase I [Clostridia bacterium]|nr:signal peptidase I [Clostridia bacterium]